MPAKTPKQQRLFGMALAYKRGEFDGEVTDKIKELSELPEKTLLKYAKTKHSKIKEGNMETISKILSFDDWVIENAATTTSVIGMGNVTPPTLNTIGSGDTFGSIIEPEDDEDEEEDILKENLSKNIDMNKGVAIFDLDDTLIMTNAKIWITTKNGKSITLTPKEFTTWTITPTDEIDFSEFSDPNILQGGVLIDKTMDILKSSYTDKKAVAIVTARSDKEMIKNFFSNMGIFIHNQLIWAVNNPKFRKQYPEYSGDIPMLKRKAVKDIIDLGFKTVDFYDDDKKNIEAVLSIKKSSPMNSDIKIRVNHIDF